MGVARVGRNSYSRQLAARGRATRCRSLLRSLQGPRSRDMRVQVEGGAGGEYVQPQSQHAHRLAVIDAVDGGVADLGAVDDRDPPAAFDFDRLVRTDERRGVLVETDADRERVVGQRGEQSADAVALPEMLVDDEAIGEPQTR